MLDEVPVILRDGKGSKRKRQMVATLHVALYPILLALLCSRRACSPFATGSSKRRAGSPATPKILLIRVDGIGDLTMSAAIFPALRETFPNAQIDLLTSSAAAPVGQLLKDAGWIHTVYTQPLLGRGWKTFRDLIRQLKPNHYDVAIDLRGDARNVLLITLLGVPRRLGLFGSGFSYALTDALRLPMPHHQADEPTALVKQLGVTGVSDVPRLPISEALLTDADAWLANHGMIYGQPIVAFHLTAFQPSKVWPLERFIDVARQLHQQIDAQFVIVGGDSDRPAADRFAAAVGGNIAIAAGRRNIIQTAAILSRCAGLIGNDSGPAHLAGAVGIGVVVIFGNGSPTHFGVRSPRAALLRRAAPCDPRCDKACAVPDRFCMRDVSVEEVVAAAIEKIV